MPLIFRHVEALANELRDRFVAGAIIGIDGWTGVGKTTLATIALWKSADLRSFSLIFDDLFADQQRLYSAAYIMPSPKLGGERKHANHLALLWRMMDDGLPSKISAAASLRGVYELLRSYPGVGPFLGFQYAIDLNYSELIDFDEADFVVAGPGALDGLAKCFSRTNGRSPDSVIRWMVENQEQEFAKRGLEFPGLFGRALQPIDCQNLFCEVSKYARVAHPSVRGVADRIRIKQLFRKSPTPLPAPFFPPKWRLKSATRMLTRQPSFLTAMMDASSK